MTKFDTFGLAKPLLRALSAEGYETPTPIQEQAIPVLLQAHDVLGIAQTGTGKTAAFTLPVLDRVMSAKRNRTPKTCTALIVAPTRELAAQIVDNISRYSKFSKVNIALIVGGVRPMGQVKALRGGVDIVVATPGRLLDHMKTKSLVLSSTEMVVLDEADQMMDMGFLPGIRTIMKSLPQERITALFSATMPKEIKKLAGDFLHKPCEITVASVSKPIERIDQSVRWVAKNKKRSVLTDLLLDEAVERAVVFTRTKRGADRVCNHLKDAEISVNAIHGDKSQSQRDRALRQFRQGRTRILVATDIAARGIDIDDVSHVFNFDLPEVPEAYVHRIGRTARAGRSGVAISLVDPSERNLLKAIEKLTGEKLAGEKLSGDKPANDKTAGEKAKSGDRQQEGEKTAEAHEHKRETPRGKRGHRGRPTDKKRDKTRGKKPRGNPNGKFEGKSDDRTENRFEGQSDHKSDHKSDNRSDGRSDRKPKRKRKPSGRNPFEGRNTDRKQRADRQTGDQHADRKHSGDKPTNRKNANRHSPETRSSDHQGEKRGSNREAEQKADQGFRPLKRRKKNRGPARGKQRSGRAAA